MTAFNGYDKEIYLGETFKYKIQPVSRARTHITFTKHMKANFLSLTFNVRLRDAPHKRTQVGIIQCRMIRRPYVSLDC